MEHVIKYKGAVTMEACYDLQQYFLTYYEKYRNIASE